MNCLSVVHNWKSDYCFAFSICCGMAKAMDRRTKNALVARLKELQESEECYISKRFVLVVLMFFGWCLSYSLRLSLSVSILDMASLKPQKCTEDSKDFKVRTKSNAMSDTVRSIFGL